MRRVVWESGAWLFLKRWGSSRNGGDRKTQESRSAASTGAAGVETFDKLKALENAVAD